MKVNIMVARVPSRRDVIDFVDCFQSDAVARTVAATVSSV